MLLAIQAIGVILRPNVQPNLQLVDHLNINHEKGRHDLLTAFYCDVLGCALDPRKEDNLEKGAGTLWCNAGITQFHLSEGKPDAQRLDGSVTLGYASLSSVRGRLAAGPPSVLADSAFSHSEDKDGSIVLSDPWGSKFILVERDAGAFDVRGSQPGPKSEPRGILDLTFLLPASTSPKRVAGIGRFYSKILGCPVVRSDDKCVVLGTSGDVATDGATPRQTLTFVVSDAADDIAHEDLGEDEEGRSLNRGAHVSVYLRDLPSAYEKADALGLCYVNHRFSRRAYTLDEAVDQCMFRMLDVVDPEDVAAGPILRIEHEVRSCTKKDGTKYKSCPIDDETLAEFANRDIAIA